MPIKVTCACGQSFAANDALAGKRVKCPKCAQPLQIPGSAGAAATAPRPPAGGAAPAAQQPRPQQRPAASAPPADSFGSAFDEIGLKAQQVNAGPSCPNCRAPMAPGAILCVQCGFNQKLGRVMQTMTTSGPAAGGAPAGGGGHGHGGDVASKLMERAALSIEEEAESERTKTSEGMPWYGYAAMLFGALCFMAAMRFVPHGSAIVVSGLVIAFAAWMVGLYANIRLIIAAFTEDVLQGVLVLVVPCYALYYVITRWDTVGGYFIMAFVANIVSQLAVAGAMAAGSMAGGEEEEMRSIPTPPPHVLVDDSPSNTPRLHRWPS